MLTAAGRHFIECNWSITTSQVLHVQLSRRLTASSVLALSLGNARVSQGNARVYHRETGVEATAYVVLRTSILPVLESLFVFALAITKIIEKPTYILNRGLQSPFQMFLA